MSLPQALGRLRVALDDAYARSSRAVGLTPQQAELLCAAMSPSSVKDLAVQLRCDGSNVTRMVDRAAARGRVIRRGQDEDGRVTVVELTPAGRELARRFLSELETQTRPLVAGWSSDREAAVVADLHEIADSLEAGKAPPRRPRRRRTADGRGARRP